MKLTKSRCKHNNDDMNDMWVWGSASLLLDLVLAVQTSCLASEGPCHLHHRCADRTAAAGNLSAACGVVTGTGIVCTQFTCPVPSLLWVIQGLPVGEEVIPAGATEDTEIWGRACFEDACGDEPEYPNIKTWGLQKTANEILNSWQKPVIPLES